MSARCGRTGLARGGVGGSERREVESRGGSVMFPSERTAEIRPNASAITGAPFWRGGGDGAVNEFLRPLNELQCLCSVLPNSQNATKCAQVKTGSIH